jgi:hypothetical protein
MPQLRSGVRSSDDRAVVSLAADAMYDRDRTMISPRMVPGALKLFSTVELAEAYHHDAKSKLENYHRFVKASLAEIPGRILGPRIKHDLKYDPIKNTQLTRAQYVDLVEHCRRQWNTTPKASLGERSPMDIMKAFILNGSARLTDPREVRRASNDWSTAAAAATRRSAGSIRSASATATTAASRSRHRRSHLCRTAWPTTIGSSPSSHRLTRKASMTAVPNSPRRSPTYRRDRWSALRSFSVA